MTTSVPRSHRLAPRWGAGQIAAPDARFPVVGSRAASKEFDMRFFSRLLFLTFLLTAGLATPAAAFDFLGHIVATVPGKWVPSPSLALPSCPSEDYIYHPASEAVVCRVGYGAPGDGAYTKLCTMDLFDSVIHSPVDKVNCEGESLVANISVLQENTERNSTPMGVLALMLTEQPASEALEAMGFDGPLRLTGTNPTLDIQNTDDFYLTGDDFEHRFYRGGKAIIWHEDPNDGLVQLATYDLVTLEVGLEYFSQESSIVATAVRTSGLAIFPETWTGELTVPGFVHGVDAGFFPARLSMELESVTIPSLGPLGLLTVAGILAAGGGFGARRYAGDRI
ncbi:MAG: hypothetical protein AAEJ52_03110 [Myxococcota bacterium]